MTYKQAGIVISAILILASILLCYVPGLAGKVLEFSKVPVGPIPTLNYLIKEGGEHARTCTLPATHRDNIKMP